MPSGNSVGGLPGAVPASSSRLRPLRPSLHRLARRDDEDDDVVHHGAIARPAFGLSQPTCPW